MAALILKPCAISIPARASSSSSSALAFASSSPSKAASRLLSQLHRSRHSPSSLQSTLRRSQRLPKPAQLAALRQLLLQHDWQLALPMYVSITEAPWYRWNAHLHAHIVALLTKFQQQEKADLFMFGIGEKLDSRQLANLYCALIEFYGKYGLKDEMIATCSCLLSFSIPGAVFLSLKSLLQAYAAMDHPKEAEESIRDLQKRGFKPCQDDYKAVLFSFGRCGLFQDMEKIACEMEESGLLADPVVFNMILTSYAAAQKHDKIKEWLDRMSAVNVCPSARSLNALANACPALNSVLAGSSCSVSVNVDSLLEKLEAQGASSGELQTVKYLLELSLLQDAVVWAPSYWLLDLHSTAIGSAYIMLVCWLKELLHRLKSERSLPSEVIIVTGWGKHSEVRGSSSVRLMALNLLASKESPFRVDSKNKGRLLARRLAVETWLSRL